MFFKLQVVFLVMMVTSSINAASQHGSDVAPINQTVKQSETIEEPRACMDDQHHSDEEFRFQEGNIVAARPLFKQSFELSTEHKFDYHTVNAAHMVPFAAETVEEKIEWNERAIMLAENSESVRAQEWLGSLYNNIGQAYLEAKQYDKALTSLKKALECRELEGHAVNIRVARWAVARTLRLLNRSDEALPILLALLDEYDSMVKTGKLDMPAEVLPSARGLVYEELAEIGGEKTKIYAELAYDDLSSDYWFRRFEPQRLERLKQLQDGKR